MPEIIGPQSRVQLHFRLCLADGTEVDTSFGADPLSVTLGQGDLMEGLERRLMGLSAGDRRRFDIPALEAFGPIEDGTLSALPRQDFPPEIELVPGALVEFAAPQGEAATGTVVAVGETEVLIDFSHPLAGHDVIFEVEIIRVEVAA